MERAGHLRRLAGAAVALSLVGCSWAGARARDFGDLFRLEGQVGYGLSAHAHAGEIIHAGAGSSRNWSAGLLYGEAGTQTITEDHFPLSVVWSFANPSKEHVHRIKVGEEGTHRCYLIFPGALNPGTVQKHDIHYLDIEAGFLAGFVGLEAGFSLGELLDFIMGLFKWSEEWTFMDPGQDDTWDERDLKGFWLPRRTREGIFLPD